jgi:hypothetical protein
VCVWGGGGSKEAVGPIIDLLQCQKRPTTVSKETYYSVKRDLVKKLWDQSSTPTMHERD